MFKIWIIVILEFLILIFLFGLNQFKIFNFVFLILINKFNLLYIQFWNTYLKI